VHYEGKIMPRVFRSSAIVLSLLIAFQATAVTYDQVDDFQDPNDGNAGWFAGGGSAGRTAIPRRVADGGPGGAGDAYLRLASRRYHVGARNIDQWTGNYLAAGIDAIEMDLNHIRPGADAVEVRIFLFGPGGAFASANLTEPISTNAWQRYRFGLTAADLVHVTGGTGDLTDTLTAVTKLLIRHDRADPTLPGDHPPHITATLGIDNIRAVPEPADIDIKPGSDSNSINPSAQGLIPVTIFGSDTFDVAGVDGLALAFGPDGAAPAHDISDPAELADHLEDVDGDGFTDLVFHYWTEETGIAFGDMNACLHGGTLDGKRFMGCDDVRTVPDMDGDGLLDLDEEILGTNALSSDTDGDGFGDGEEVLTLATDPLNAYDPAPVEKPKRRGRRRR
jgi:hypothetical protein